MNYSVLHLSEIYPEPVYSIEICHVPRYDEISKRFSKIYGCELEFFIRVPGVVNILGDTVKLYGYAPLSVLLDQDIIFAVSKNSKKEIRVNNSQATLYGEIRFNADSPEKFNQDNMYFNFILGGYKAALNNSMMFEPIGMNVFISSNVPMKIGFNTSTSLMLAMCITTLQMNGLNKKVGSSELISELMKVETIFNPSSIINHGFSTIMLSKKNSAFLMDEESPLKYLNIELPSKFCLLIADTLTPTPKLFLKGHRQNKRLCESKIGVCMMMKKLDMKNYNEVLSLKDLQNILGYDFEEMLELLKESVNDRVYKTQEIEELLEVKIIKLISHIPYSELVVESNSDFAPYSVCFHILSECIRIESIKILSTQSLLPDDFLLKISDLMTESFICSKNNYQNISEETENLRNIMDSYGLKGIRLAHEGWGGCLIGLVEKTKSKLIVEGIMKDYYLQEKNKIFLSDDLNMYIFASKPSEKCVFFDPQYEFWF